VRENAKTHRAKIKDLKAHFVEANTPLRLCSLAGMTRDIAAPHYAHVAHPVCLGCHLFVDGVAQTQRRLKWEAALLGNTMWLEEKRRKNKRPFSAKGSQKEVVVVESVVESVAMEAALEVMADEDVAQRRKRAR